MRKIEELSLDKEIIDKLIEKNILTIEDLWKCKRTELKQMGFLNDEIKRIIISLQLIGLDLNKKKY